MRRSEDFVAVVRATLAEGKICILYADGWGDATEDPNKIWPEMRVGAFRAAVEALVPEGRFSAPDELDGWTYVCYPASLC